MMILRFRPRFSLPTRLRLLHGIPSETLEPSSSSSSDSDLTALYLTNSCGLPPVAAISAAKKLRLRTTDNADSILNHLRAHGFSQNQIAKLITKSPVVLSINFEKIVKPKLDFFLTAGFPSAAIARVITCNPTLLRTSLARKLEPNFVHLKTILGGAHEAARAISNDSVLLELKLPGNMLHNMKTLEEHGVPRDRIIKMATSYTRLLFQCPARFSKAAAFLKETGFDPLKDTFVRGIVAICKVSHSTRERKLQLYRSLGWSEEDIDLLFKNFPFCVLLSEEKIKQTMSFYVEKLKWEHSFLAARPNLLSFSLPKTILPRYNVFNILESNGLAKRIHLSTLLLISEKRFLDRFVIKYGEKVPELLQAYKVKLDLARLKESQITTGFHINNNIS